MRLSKSVDWERKRGVKRLNVLYRMSAPQRSVFWMLASYRWSLREMMGTTWRLSYLKVIIDCITDGGEDNHRVREVVCVIWRWLHEKVISTFVIKGTIASLRLLSIYMCMTVCSFVWFYLLKLLFFFTLKFFHVNTLITRYVKLEGTLQLTNTCSNGVTVIVME